MKNKGFLAFLIDSFLSFLISIIVLIIFHKNYNQSTSTIKIILLLAVLLVIPICFSVILASASGKKTLGRRIVKNHKFSQKSSKKKIYNKNRM